MYIFEVVTFSSYLMFIQWTYFFSGSSNILDLFDGAFFLLIIRMPMATKLARVELPPARSSHSQICITYQWGGLARSCDKEKYISSSTDFKLLFDKEYKLMDLSSGNIMVSSSRCLLDLKLMFPVSQSDIFYSTEVPSFLRTCVQISWEGITGGKNDLMSLLLPSWTKSPPRPRFCTIDEEKLSWDSTRNLISSGIWAPSDTS